MRANGGVVDVRRRWVVAGVLLALAAAGCRSGPLKGLDDAMGLGRRVVPNDWVLLGISPDERVLRVETFYGGEASDCNRWMGAEIDENDERISVRMLLSQVVAPAMCTDEGITRTATVRLKEPLGDREFVGCGADPALCRQAPREDRHGRLSWPERTVAFAPGVVVTAGREGVVGLDIADGAVLWRHAAARAGGWTTLLAVEDTVLVASGDGGVTAYDVRTGEPRWQAPTASGGHQPVAAVAPAADGGSVALLVAPGGELEAREPRDGTVRWTAAAPTAQPMGLASGGGVAVVLAADPGANGPHAGTVAVYDLADGRERWRRTVPERLGAVGVVGDTVLAHGGIVRYAWDVLDGAQRWRVPPVHEFARLEPTSEGPAAVWDGNVVVYDAITSYPRLRFVLPEALSGTIGVAGDRVLLSTMAGDAEMRGLDGTVMMRAALGGAGGRPAFADGLLAVPTHLGVSVFDEDGELRWWWDAEEDSD